MKTIFCLTTALLLAADATAQPIELHSPDGNLAVVFSLSDGRPTYRVEYRGKPILLESPLGLEIDKCLRSAGPQSPANRPRSTTRPGNRSTANAT